MTLQVLQLYKSQKSQICKEYPWYNFGKCHYGNKKKKKKKKKKKNLDGTQK